MVSKYNAFSAGKKVYSKGSFAPTKGTVDPSGYLKRELEKRGQLKAKARSMRGRPGTPNRDGINRVINQQRILSRYKNRTPTPTGVRYESEHSNRRYGDNVATPAVGTVNRALAYIQRGKELQKKKIPPPVNR